MPCALFSLNAQRAHRGEKILFHLHFRVGKEKLKGVLRQDKWNKYQPCKIVSINTDKRIFAGIFR